MVLGSRHVIVLLSSLINSLHTAHHPSTKRQVSSGTFLRQQLTAKAQIAHVYKISLVLTSIPPSTNKYSIWISVCLFPTSAVQQLVFSTAQSTNEPSPAQRRQGRTCRYRGAAPTPAASLRAASRSPLCRAPGQGTWTRKGQPPDTRITVPGHYEGPRYGLCPHTQHCRAEETEGTVMPKWLVCDVSIKQPSFSTLREV